MIKERTGGGIERNDKNECVDGRLEGTAKGYRKKGRDRREATGTTSEGQLKHAADTTERKREDDNGRGW